MKPTAALRSFLLGSSILAATPALHAANLYWDGSSASWNIAANWSTVSGATTPDPSAIPGILDDVFFNMASGSGTKLVTLDADQSAKSLTDSYIGGVVNIVGGGAQRTLTLGTGGLTMAAGSSILFGNGNTPANRALINLTSGAQTWTNNSTSNLTMANGAAAFTRDVGATLNFNKVGTGNFVISNVEMPLVNGIVGNWAFNGTGASMRYATTAGNIASYTTATSQTFSTVNSATTNYTTGLVESVGINANLTANTLHYTGTAGLYDYNNTGAVSWLYTVNGILATGASGALTFQRAGGVNNTSTMRIGNTNELVIAGQQNVTFNQLGISGATASTGALTYSGTGTLTLGSGSAQSASTYGGGTTVNSGTVTLSGATATLGASTGTLSVNGGILNMSTTNDLTVGRLNGVGGTINITNGRTLTVNQTTAGNYDGVIAGTGGAFTLGASSANTLTLTGTNTYSGTTTISGGSLALSGSGSIANSSAITINSSTSLSVTGLTGNFTVGASQSLGGSGTLTATGKTVIANGTLTPGNSPGTLTQDGGTLQLGVGGDLNWQVYDASGLAGTGYDTVSLINGATLDLSALSAGNTYNINLWSLSAIGPDANGDAINFNNSLNYAWTLFSTGDTITGFDTSKFTINTGAFNGTSGFSNTPNGSFQVALGDSNTDLVLTYTAVPEPGAALLGSLGLLALLRRRRA